VSVAIEDATEEQRATSDALFALTRIVQVLSELDDLLTANPALLSAHLQALGAIARLADILKADIAQRSAGMSVQ
jgi:hypothetical protein